MVQSHYLVLLVEDDDDIRDLSYAALSHLGYEVVAASNGDEALRILEDDGRIALLFTDIRMPGRLDGVALAREAKRQRPDLKILYTTAYADQLSQDDIDRVGGQLLLKPYRLSELHRRVLDLMARGAS